jgi:hypothetical protein
LILVLGESGYLSKYSGELWARWPGFDSQQKQYLSLLHTVRAGSGDYPAGAISPEVKWLGHKADHSNPFSAEVKNGGVIPPLPHVFMA